MAIALSVNRQNNHGIILLRVNRHKTFENVHTKEGQEYLLFEHQS